MPARWGPPVDRPRPRRRVLWHADLAGVPPTDRVWAALPIDDVVEALDAVAAR
jgi:hypothetical protein